jgi:hypothetical protein
MAPTGYQGIVGFGPKDGLVAGTDSYLDALLKTLADNTIPDQMAFLLCAQRMWFAGYDPTVNTAPATANNPNPTPPDIAFTPLLATSASNPFYAFQVSDVALGTTSLRQSLGNVVVATGWTHASQIPDAAETALVNAINAAPGFATLFPGQTIADTATGSCVVLGDTTLGDSDVDSMMPQMNITLPKPGGGTAKLTLNATKSYFVSAGMGTYCLTFSGSGMTSTAGSLFGSTFVADTFTVIDNDAKQIGFAPPDGCIPPPSASGRVAPRVHKTGASSPLWTSDRASAYRAPASN